MKETKIETELNKELLELINFSDKLFELAQTSYNNATKVLDVIVSKDKLDEPCEDDIKEHFSLSRTHFLAQQDLLKKLDSLSYLYGLYGKLGINHNLKAEDVARIERHLADVYNIYTYKDGKLTFNAPDFVLESIKHSEDNLDTEGFLNSIRNEDFYNKSK